MTGSTPPSSPPRPRFRLVQPSTWRLFAEGRRARDYSFFDALHGYVYGRWIYQYIGIGTGEHPIARKYQALSRSWQALKHKLGLASESVSTVAQPANGNGKKPHITMADTYHGKVVPLEAAKQLVLVNEPVRLENLEKIIPYARARDIILQNPDHIIAMDCPCRSAREHPCLPLDVCLVIGEPFASFVAEHHPDKMRWITPQEAVGILQTEDERGHVHHAFFKDAMLGRFYAICNCCECCCGALHAHQHGNAMLASSGYLCQVEEDNCMACGECQAACQFGALQFTTQEQMQHRLYGITVDESLCMGCGVCAGQCINSALSLRRAPEKGEPLELFALMEHATLSPAPG